MMSQTERRALEAQGFGGPSEPDELQADAAKEEEGVYEVGTGMDHHHHHQQQRESGTHGDSRRRGVGGDLDSDEQEDFLSTSAAVTLSLGATTRYSLTGAGGWQSSDKRLQHLAKEVLLLHEEQQMALRCLKRRQAEKLAAIQRKEGLEKENEVLRALLIKEKMRTKALEEELVLSRVTVEEYRREIADVFADEEEYKRGVARTVLDRVRDGVRVGSGPLPVAAYEVDRERRRVAGTGAVTSLTWRQRAALLSNPDTLRHDSSSDNIDSGGGGGGDKHR